MGQATDDNRHMRIACCITKATNTHLQYVIFIAFPLQHWLHERAEMLCYTSIACLVIYSVKIQQDRRIRSTIVTVEEQ
jgi:hypothetical protein